MEDNPEVGSLVEVGGPGLGSLEQRGRCPGMEGAAQNSSLSETIT